MNTTSKYARFILWLGIIMVIGMSCAPPPLEVFFSPNPEFQSANQNTTPSQQQQPAYQPFVVQTPPATNQVDSSFMSIQRVNDQLTQLMSEADASILSGEARLQEFDLPGAVRELERARLILEQDIRPTFTTLRQAQIQSGIQVLSNQYVQQVDRHIVEMQSRINQAYNLQNLYIAQRKVDRFDALRQESKPVLQAVSVQQPSTLPPTQRIRELPRPRIQTFPGRFDIDVGVLSEEIDRALRRLQQRRHDFQSCLSRMEGSFSQVSSILAKYGVPEDFIYVALIESGFQPDAESSSGKAGLWQLSPEIARRYGLRVTSSRDDRKDIQASTAAFAKYISRLYQRFGSWEMALLGVVKGEQGLQNLVNRVGSYDFSYLQRRLGPSSQEGEFLALLTAGTAIAIYPDSYGFGSNMTLQTGISATQTAAQSRNITLEPPAGTLY